MSLVSICGAIFHFHDLLGKKWQTAISSTHFNGNTAFTSPCLFCHKSWSYSVTPRPNRSSRIDFSVLNNLSYCWWKTFCTIWDVWSPVNNGLNYQSPNKKLSYKLPSLKLTYPLKMGLSKKESIPPSTIFQGLTIPTQDFIIFTFSTTPTVFTAGTLQTGKPGNNVVAVSGVMEFTIPEAIRAGGKWDESQPYSRETNGQ